MDKTLAECEREIYKEYREKVARLNEQEALCSETRYHLTHIMGKSGSRDLKIQVIRQGKLQHVLSLDYVDRKLLGRVRRKSVNRTEKTTELNQILFDTIQLIGKFRLHSKFLT